ncbi:MAG TPA: lytic murein transglycosylase [Alphaproteobacteria bacterium]|nr:lytic murein transglycosylase [Alphaproteobacteria bacterium]
MGLRRASIALVLAAGFTAAGIGSAPGNAEEKASTPSFQDWLQGVRQDALDKGISKGTVDKALAGLEIVPRVVELDNAQPEFTQTFQDYISRRLTPKRIEFGRKQTASEAKTLDAVAKAYGVQARFIAAIWGVETNFGRITGSYQVVPSLATLAYTSNGRRGAYFRSELIDALKIVDEGHIDLAHMKGSWAGAMGQGQFMPSSFLVYARDFDGDGRKDIWDDPADVFASIANYLKVHGWRDDLTWGRRVRLPAGFDVKALGLEQETPPKTCSRALKEHTRMLPLSRWQELGVRRLDGRDLPVRDVKASLVQPGGKDGPAFLTYANYRSILRYNCSNFYAIAVGMLSDAL